MCLYSSTKSIKNITALRISEDIYNNLHNSCKKIVLFTLRQICLNTEIWSHISVQDISLKLVNNRVLINIGVNYLGWCI